MRLVCAIFFAVSLLAQSRLIPDEERGKQIFERGVSPSGAAITATMAGGETVPGAVLPCANCHGVDGQGRPEGGVLPSNITWDALTKPYQTTRPDGRTHPPYTERLLKRAITMGIDPAGNTLQTEMPRFQLSMADASYLIAYIEQLGQTVEPGVTATTVRLGVILSTDSYTHSNAILRNILLDYFARVNGAGGIFGRRIELSFLELPLDRSTTMKTVRDFLGKEQVFAVTAADFSGRESELAAMMREYGTPSIATFALFPESGSPPNPYIFYLDGGVEEELEALLDFAARRFPRAVATPLVTFADESSREAAKRLETRLRKPGNEPLDGSTIYLIPSSAAVRTGASMDNRIFVALGTASPDGNAMPDLQRLAWDRMNASAQIMAEALRRAGRTLTRASLIAALENLRGWQTTLPVPLSFGPEKRIGASRVRIMELDAGNGKFIPAEGGAQSK